MLNDKEHEELSSLIEKGLLSIHAVLEGMGSPDFNALQMRQRASWIDVENYINSLRQPKTFLGRVRMLLGRLF